MPSLAATLKAEVRRHAAREARRTLRSLRRLVKQVKALRLVNRTQRRSLVALAHRFDRLKTRVASVRAAARRSRGGGGVPGRPLSPQSIYNLRSRLGLSRIRFARLLGVSPGSIFGWEKGRTMPRGASRARIAEVRKMGLKAARARIQGSPAGRRRSASRRPRRRAGARRARRA